MLKKKPEVRQTPLAFSWHYVNKISEDRTNILTNKQMYKNYTQKPDMPTRRIRKFMHIMKLTTIILIASIVQVSAASYGQKITLKEKDAPLESIFKEMHSQSGYDFFFDQNLLKKAKPVTVDLKNLNLDDALNACLANQPFIKYVIEDKTVVIKANPLALLQPTKVVLMSPVNITGAVKDNDGKTLPGVTVLNKTTGKATSTNAEGVFKIDANPGDILVFSFVGFQKKEVLVKDQSTLSVVLNPSIGALNDIVITGFGESRSKRTLGYAVTQVVGDDLRRSNATNPIDALQGLVAGLQVSPGVSGPSATPKFLIRGSSSLNPYGNTPLIVVDNVVMDQQTVTPNQSGQYGSSADFGNILKDINMDDVESISVVKGGAVTALYGSRANNGVILIKMKKGFKQKGLGISVSETMIFEKAYKTVDMQNVYGSGFSTTDMDTLANGKLQINPNSYGVSFGPKMNGQTILDPSGHEQKNLPFNPLSMYRTGVTNNTNLAISGGDEQSSFRFSYSNDKSNSITPNNSFSRNSYNLRGTRNMLNNILQVDGNVSYVRTSVYNPALQGGNSILYGLSYNNGARNYDLNYWKNHYIDPVNGGVNNADPLGFTHSLFSLYQNKMFQNENTMIGSLEVKAHLTPWLTFRTLGAINLWDRSEESDTRGQDPSFNNPNYSSNINNTLTTRLLGDFTANKTFGEFDTQLQVGGEMNRGETKGASYSLNGALYPDIYRLSNSRNPANVYESTPNINQLNSLYGQASIEWRKYLTLNLYGRNDWNSTLVYNDGHGKYGYLYGGSDIAWVFSDMFKLPKVIDYAKLRLSYALTGNGTSNYTTNTGAYSSGTYISNNGTINTAYYSSNTLPNQNLVPESSNKIETGLEFKMFKNRFGGDITYYKQDTKNQIIPFSAPSTSGVGSILINGGKVRNSGLEVVIFGTPLMAKDFSWTTQVNYTRNRNKIVSLPLSSRFLTLSQEDGISTVAEAGGSYAEMVSNYGYARYQAKDASGNNISSSLNGMPVIYPRGGGTRMAFTRAQDYGTDPVTRQPVLGSTVPDFLGGWRNTFNYKSFSLNVLLDAKFGGLVYSTTYNYGSETGMLANTLFGRDAAHGGISYTPAPNSVDAFGASLGSAKRDDGIVFNAVFAPNSKTVGTDGALHDVSGMTYKDAVAKGWALPTDATSAYEYQFGWSRGIREASAFTSSWVSLREVSVGYDLPKKICNKFKVNGMQFIISARNLIYLYNSAKDHVNPDFLDDSGSGSAFEHGGIPYVRNFSGTLKASF